MIELILLLSVILLGLLIGNKRVDKWLFLKALLLFSVMLSVSILISVAMYLLLTMGVANVIELTVRVVISFRDSRYHQYESFVIFFIEFNDEKNCFTHRFNENN